MLMKKTAKTKKKWPFFVAIVGTVFILSAVLLWVFVFNKNAKAPALNNINLQLLAGDFTQPTSIVSANDDRLFIVEQVGRIKIIDINGKVNSQPFLDINSKVFHQDERGLLGLAFHPDYPTKPYFYVNYINKSQETIIARYTVSSDKNTADPNSEKVLMTIQQPYTNHNGGDLSFGPDGYLYIALGDGGSAGDPGNRAQNKNSLFGKILRINIDSGNPYSIPQDNPFNNKPNSRAEIWAYGLRNPWRMSFDKSTGDLYIADVGQGDIEEIDFQKANSSGGINYGWRCYEGSKAYNTEGCQNSSNYEQPIIEYSHTEGRCAITGGYVYRGSKYPNFTGKYFFGDFCGGQIYYTSNNNGTWQQTLALDTNYSISAFGQDNKGELYLADYGNGNVYRIIATE